MGERKQSLHSMISMLAMLAFLNKPCHQREVIRVCKSTCGDKKFIGKLASISSNNWRALNK